MIKRLLVVFLATFFSIAHAATLLPPGEQTFFDANGNPLAGGTVTFYIPNTTTFKNTWKDSGQTILNTNPVILDSSGRAIIYGSGTYRQIVKDSLGNIIWDRITADTSSSTISWGGTSGGSGNSQTINAANFSSADGQIISFIAGFTNTGPTTINPNGAGPISVVKDTAAGAVPLTGGEIVAGNSVSVIYDSSAGVFHLISYPFPTDFSTSTITAGTLTSAGTFKLTGVITPASLAVNTDDWNPAGFADSAIVRASSVAAITLSGLQARDAGTVVDLQNVGSNTITLVSNNAGSLAANRFVFARSLELHPSESVLLWYDQTSTGWRLVHPHPSLPVAPGFKKLFVQATTATQVTATADYITLEEDSGAVYRAKAVNVTANMNTTGANGLDTGIEAPDTWYSVWIIYNPTTNTAASLLSLSETAPTMPAGYTYKARVSWVRNDASSNFFRYVQYGRRAQYVAGTNPVNPRVMATGPAAQWTAVAWANFAPPTTAVLYYGFNNGGSTQTMFIVPNNSYSAGNAFEGFTVSVGNDTYRSSSLVVESANVYWYTSAALPIYLHGWEDNL